LTKKLKIVPIHLIFNFVFCLGGKETSYIAVSVVNKAGRAHHQRVMIDRSWLLSSHLYQLLK